MYFIEIASLLFFALAPAAYSDFIDLARQGTWQYKEVSSCGDGTTRCGPAKWHSIAGNAACNEQGTQSPIDVEFKGAPVSSEISTSSLSLKSGVCNWAHYILNGHTTSVRFDGACQDMHYVNFNDTKFFMTSIHFHSPSEHTIDGGHLPMEVHHVHTAANGQALAIAVMVNVGTPLPSDAPKAEYLRNLFDSMPSSNQSSAVYYNESKKAPSTGLDPYTSFIPSLSDSFYYYVGSFTSPPCTTDTIWIMASAAIKVPQATLDMYRTMINSKENNQLAAYGEIIGQNANIVPKWHKTVPPHIAWNSSLGCNNRPIQTLGGNRTIYKVVQQSSVAKDGLIASSSGSNSRLILYVYLVALTCLLRN
jgi:carbonic anhydrase